MRGFQGHSSSGPQKQTAVSEMAMTTYGIRRARDIKDLLGCVEPTPGRSKSAQLVWWVNHWGVFYKPGSQPPNETNRTRQSQE